ncbi:glycosyltransferase family 4 protein [Salinibacter ruber]|uniref:glycosyltransferase family 4 protein n=1 Tax=Salinibacter ruber TaxID=146919 RepID=UPI00160A72B9
MRIAHVITSLQTGGAETILYRHLRNDRAGTDISLEDGGKSSVVVISLKDEGPMGERIKELGIPVHAMNIHKEPVRGIGRLYNTLSTFDPHLVQTWLYHADLLGGLVGRMQGRPVIWSIHWEHPLGKTLKRSTRLVTRLNAWGSSWIPDHIISCSKTAADAHVRFGYPEEKMSVIPNGFELDQFRPDSQCRTEVRDELGIASKAPVVGMVARYHPQKDHENFLRAAVLAQQRIPSLHFVLAGTDVRPEVDLFREYQHQFEPGTLHLLGHRNDVPRLMPMLDVASLSSNSEAFPMVLGEAMASGVPCVATDVGDVAYLLGDTGILVPPEDPEALADGWLQLLEAPDEDREERGRAARRRVQENFSQEAVLEQYDLIYERLAHAG